MDERSETELGLWDILRMRAYLFVAGFLRGMTLGVRVMLVQGDRVLLVRHTYLRGWHLPGGGIEVGEVAEEAAAREVMEETGYRMTERPQLFGFYHNLSPATRRDHVALYVCASHERVRPIVASREIAAAEWFARDALPPETTRGTRRRIAEVFERRPAATRW